MDSVVVDGVTYKLIKEPTNDVETFYDDNDMLQCFPTPCVTGIGERGGHYYEIVWFLRGDYQAKNGADEWVDDWNVADRTNLNDDLNNNY